MIPGHLVEESIWQSPLLPLLRERLVMSSSPHSSFPFASVTSLLTALAETQLLDTTQVESLAHTPPDTTAQALAQELVQRGWLTTYQLQQLSAGQRQALTLGPYLLLEQLGVGGMGVVYRARQRRLNRIVALKVIKPERLKNETVVKRFVREIRAVAQLNHPNIVRAYDADQVEGAHFLVMEYVEGVNLYQLVKAQGPLPVAQACDFIRQAALGLQHAAEHGLVHRDIKPHNLLLSRENGLVKILDLGLARLEEPATEASTTMTQEGMVMGTPDYLAPEQCRNSHTVDIRADLYSLGCTFYFLLTGKPPFSGGSMTQKLLRHQLDRPEPVNQRRPEVSEEVTAIVQQLLAKRPDERYQTPNDLAQALVDCLSQQTLISRTVMISAVTAPGAAEADLPTLEGTLPALQVFRQKQAQDQQWGRLLWWLAPAFLLLLVVLGVGYWWPAPRKSPENTLAAPLGHPLPRPVLIPPKPSEPQFPESHGPVTEAWVQAVQTLRPEQQVQAVFAKLAKLNPGFAAAKTKYTVRDGKVVQLEIQQAITDLAPLRALRDLYHLSCTANGDCPTILSIADLSPLRWLPLRFLSLPGNRVEDLSPLAGRKLETLDLTGNRVSDLSPLRGMTTLNRLVLSHNPVTDLSPLQGSNLRQLILTSTPVQDLKPLAGLPLTHLNLDGTSVSDLTALSVEGLDVLSIALCPITDLSPLAKSERLRVLYLNGVPFRSLEPVPGVQELWLSFDPAQAPVLQQRSRLKSINGLPVGAFWKLVDPDPAQEQWTARVANLPAEEQIVEVQKRMWELNPEVQAEPKFKLADGGVVEADFGPTANLVDTRFLSPLHKLQKLSLLDAFFLEPLRRLPLKSLVLASYSLRDLSPLTKLPLEDIDIRYSTVSDLTPLAAIRSLRRVKVNGPISQVAPLASLPLTGLELVHAHSPGDLHRLKDMKTLEWIRIPYDDWRQRDTLRAMTWLRSINGKKPEDFWKDVAEQQVEFVRRELKRLNPGFQTEPNAQIKPDGAIWLNIFDDALRDLSPLRYLPDLKVLGLGPQGDLAELVELTDLQPLAGLKKLTHLSIHRCTRLKDLAPLRGLPLVSLAVHNSSVEDLTPVSAMPLHELVMSLSKVQDLAPVKGLQLTNCVVDRSPVRDHRILAGLPLRTVALDFEPYRDADWLRKMSGLKKINNRDVAEFWQDFDAKQTAFQKWCAEVAKLPAKELAAAVEKELRQRNPEFGGRFNWGSGNSVFQIDINEGVGLKDLSPLRALPDLKVLACNRCPNLASLWSLHGLRLERASFNSTSVRDLTPLQGMPLKVLSLNESPISDLGPLQGLSLEELDCGFLPITDCHALSGMTTLKKLTLSYGKNLRDVSGLSQLPLEWLSLFATPLADVAPLHSLKLKWVDLRGPSVTDLAFLKDMPLEHLRCSFLDWRDSRSIRAIRSLKVADVADVRTGKTVEGVEPKQLHAWADWEDAVRAAPPERQLEMVQGKLIELNNPGIEVKGESDANAVSALLLHGDIKDLSPVRALPRLDTLSLGYRERPLPLDLTPLQGLQLTRLTIRTSRTPNSKAIADLAPLASLPLKYLDLHGSNITSLEPLRGLQLDVLHVSYCQVTDLAPLRAMPLQILGLNANWHLTDLKSLTGMHLTELSIAQTKVADLTPLQEMKTLRVLNCKKTAVKDLTPLRNTNLEELLCDLVPQRDGPILRQIRTLQMINGKKTAEVLP